VKSSSKFGAEAGISASSALQILIRNKYHPYKIKLVQHLAEDDFTFYNNIDDLNIRYKNF
jgi:hypothetical protein